MEKKIINEVNRNLTIMGLSGNLILEGVPSEVLSLIGYKALKIFKENISGPNIEANTLKLKLRSKGINDKFLDDNPKFWNYYTSTNQNVGKYIFANDAEVYDLIEHIIKYDAGYFPIIFRGSLKKNDKPINFDLLISNANSTKIETTKNATTFLRNNIDLGDFNNKRFIKFFTDYVVNYKNRNIFVNDLPNFKKTFFYSLTKKVLNNEWGLAFDSFIKASTTSTERLNTNLQITINKAVNDLKNNPNQNKQIYDDLYKDIELTFLAYYQKSNESYTKTLEIFRDSVTDSNETKDLINKILGNLTTGGEPTGMYKIIETLAPDDKRTLWTNARLKFGYGIQKSSKFLEIVENPIVKEVINKATPSLYKKVIDKLNVAPGTIAKVLATRPAQTFAFGVLPNRNLILKYLSEVKFFSDENLMQPRGQKIVRYLRAYGTIQTYSLVRKVIIYAYLPIFTATIQAFYNIDSSIFIRNHINRQISTITGKSYKKIEYNGKNVFFDLFFEYLRKDFTKLFKWIVASNLNSFGAFASPVMKNIILPGWWLSTTEAFVWKSILYPTLEILAITKKLPSFDYSDYIDSLFIPLNKKVKIELDENNPERIQAGGTGIDVTEKPKTWKYSNTKKPGLKFIIIDYPFSDIKELKINGKVNSNGKSYDNNTTRISVTSNETISKISIVDKNRKTLIVRYAK